MPIEVSIDREKNLVRRTITGAVGIDEAIADLEETNRQTTP
jgi:hypothetical protein